MPAAKEKVDGRECPPIYQDGATTNNRSGQGGYFITAPVEAPECPRAEANGPAPGDVNPAGPELDAQFEGES
jgi:hypothetical protein